jgi:hypothetical protein
VAGKMSGQIFISYRREESRWSAKSLRDRLCRDFASEQIFMDIDAIALGEDFVNAIETTVAKCDVLIAVIGANWLDSKDRQGVRRLDNPDDFVRMEIGAALKREIRVIPVLVDGALMPRATDLPEDLKSLVRRNALPITDTSFDGDCQRLAAAIKLVLEKAAAEEQQREKDGLEAERPEAEQRQRESMSNSKTVPPIPVPSQDRGPTQPETPPIIQNHRKEVPKLFIRLSLLMARFRVQLTICAMILIVCGMWFGGLNYVNSPLKPAVSIQPEDIQAVVKSAGDTLRQLSKDQAQKALNELKPGAPESPNPQEEITEMLVDTTTMEQALKIAKALQDAKRSTPLHPPSPSRS